MYTYFFALLDVNISTRNTLNNYIYQVTRWSIGATNNDIFNAHVTKKNITIPVTQYI